MNKTYHSDQLSQFRLRNPGPFFCVLIPNIQKELTL
jgi:hypothetical protein